MQVYANGLSVLSLY